MIAADVSAALLLGVLGAGHCLGMCGGILAGLSAAKNTSAPATYVLLYNLGRVLSYGILGALAAGLVDITPDSGWPIARTVAGVILILMGAYVAGWWNAILILERVGGWFWRLLQPLVMPLLPIRSAKTALLVGFAWGWLPCGLVYSALAYAAGQGNALAGGMVMLAFGLGTLPALILGGWAIASVNALTVKKLLQRKGVKNLLGLTYVLFGLWTVVIAWQHVGHHSQAEGDSQQGDHSHHHNHH